MACSEYVIVTIDGRLDGVYQCTLGDLILIFDPFWNPAQAFEAMTA